MKIAGSIATRDGYITNLFDGSKLNNLNRKSLRGGLLWKPTETLEVALSGSWLKQADRLLLGQVADNTSGGLAGLPGYFTDPYTVSQDHPSLQSREIWGTNLNVDWHVGGFHGHLDQRLWRQPFPPDRRRRRPPDPAVHLGLPGPRPPVHPGTAAGLAHGRQDRLPHRAVLPASGCRTPTAPPRSTAPPGPAAFVGTISSISTLKTNAYAAFASANWRPLPGLTISGGLRINTESKDLVFDQTNSSFVPLPNLSARLHRKDSNLSGNASVSYEVVPDTRLYVSAARGFKSGGFNPDIVGSTDISFGPEKAWSFEAGIKSDLFDHKLRINAAGFYTDYKDLQVSALVGAAFPDPQRGGRAYQGLRSGSHRPAGARARTQRGRGLYRRDLCRFPRLCPGHELRRTAVCRSCPSSRSTPARK